jgi:two-component system response regulator HydG
MERSARKTGDGLKVLVIDDEPLHAEAVAETLQRVGYDCTVAVSGQAGARRLEQDEYDVILTDLKMADLDGLAILRKAQETSPEAKVILITGHGDVKTAVQAMQNGAAHYLTKPVDLAELRTIVDKVSESVRLARANRELLRRLDEKFGFEGVIGNSPRMREVITRLQAIAPTNSTVLIYGETGTGKDLVARAIHNNSPRKNKPFVALNCTALNENLLDDELFGHEAHSYTGADKMRKGRFEYANGGTLFLDEVGDMPPNLQAKLLRVLENHEVFRIGSNEAIKVDVRVVAATHRDLEKAVEEGKFRQDLYFRLNKIRLKLPALRERREDIPLLAARFMKEFAEENGKKVTAISEPVRRLMAGYDWPGNVRELRNFIESMVVLDVDSTLGMDDIQEDSDILRKSKPMADGSAAGTSGLVGRTIEEINRWYAERTLEMTGGKREEAARILGIGERTLYRMIKDWELQDRIRDTLAEVNGDVAAAAKRLGLDEAELQRKMKKTGLQDDGR